MGSRRSVLSARVLADERAGAELQAEVAAELLNLMSELGLADTYDAIQATLERVGRPALRPTCWHMRREWPEPSARRGARAAAGIMEDHGPEVSAELSADVLEWARQFVGDERQSHGEFAYPLASACGYTTAGSDAFDDVLDELLADLWRMPYCMDALEALAVMAGSPNADTENQERLFEMFDTILAAQARVGGGKRRETEEGPVYEFGREIEFDIRAVPAAVRGFERIYLSEQAADAMRTQIVHRMLVLWEGVSKVRIVWGPAGIQALVDAMCAAACSEHADPPTRVRLGTSLLRFLNKLSVVRSIGRICSQPDDAEPMQQMALEAGGKLLAEWHEADQQDEERRLALLQAMGRIAAGDALPPGEEAATLRERVMQALFAGLREGMRQVREPLLALREAEGVTDAQRHEIDERLAKVFGLVKT
jgi:hypothetical protein